MVSAITVVVNWAYVRKRPGREIDKFRNVPYNIEVCNFGSSHGKYAFEYLETGKVGFNFALGSQMPTYDVRILKSYLNHFAEGAIVFIPISFFSFYGLSEEDRDGFASKNKRYYEFLPYENIKYADGVTKLFVAYLPALTADEELFSVLFGQEDDDPIETKTTNKEDAEASAYSRYLTHIVADKFDDSGKRIVNEEEIQAVYELIEMCRKNELVPVLITTPFLSEYVDAIEENDPSFFLEFYGALEEIIDKTGVQYLDFSRDERFSHNYNLFLDIDHLNEKGAELFTCIALSQLRQLHLYRQTLGGIKQ